MPAPRQSLFERTHDLTQTAPGVFERTLDHTWWGFQGQFGGHVLALALEAFRGSVTDAAHHEISMSLHFLRRVAEGPLRIEVDVVRVGRTITNMSCSMMVGDKPVALGLALFGSDRASDEFELTPAPELVVPTTPPTGSQIPANAMNHLDIWDGPHQGRVGWMRLAEPGGADARFGLFAADGMLPLSFGRNSRPQVGGTVDFTAHFREQFPQSIIDGDEPVAVVLRTGRSYRGYVDEDAELWSADGRLLMQTRQTRYSEYAPTDMLDQVTASAQH